MARVGYNKPTKSSAEGGIQNLYWDLFLPSTSALAFEYLLCLPTPVVASNNWLNSEFKLVLDCIHLASPLIPVPTNILLTTSTFALISSANKISL